MSRRLLVFAAAALLASLAPFPAWALAGPVQAVDVMPQAAEAASVVDAFHAALKAGNTDAALALLSEDVTIFEEGGAERSRSEYEAHHLGADAAYAAASESTMSRRAGWVSGDAAVITSEGTTTGQAGNSATVRMTVETMILKRDPQGWRIQHIHWSSRAAPAA